jgi:hypothetical protein
MPRCRGLGDDKGSDREARSRLMEAAIEEKILPGVTGRESDHAGLD